MGVGARALNPKAKNPATLRKAKETEQVLNKTRLHTVGAFLDNIGGVHALIGSYGTHLQEFSFWKDDRPLELGDDIKSISGEETFLLENDDRKTLRPCLRVQTSDTSDRLKRRLLGAHTVQVKVRHRDATTVTPQITLDEP